MLGWGETDKVLDTKGEFKKMAIGIIFMIAIPLLIASAANVDIIKGCLLDVKVDADGNPILDAAGNEQQDCIDLQTDNRTLNSVLGSVDEYLPLGIRLLMLGMGVAIFIGPGWKIMKHELG